MYNVEFFQNVSAVIQKVKKPSTGLVDLHPRYLVCRGEGWAVLLSCAAHLCPQVCFQHQQCPGFVILSDRGG